MIVYKTTNLVNGKIYVGKDLHNNPTYLGSGLKLVKAIKKYGKENFKKEILEECSSEADLAVREVFWIEELGAMDTNVGYNIAEGGHGGNTRKGYSTEEINHYRQKMSKAMLESQNYQESISKRRGVTRPDHSEKMKELYRSGKLLAHNKGIPTPDSVKEKISKANKGRKLSEEHKSKIGRSKWVQVEKYDLAGNLLDTYASIHEAYQSNDLSRDQVSGCLTGRYKVGGGYVWKYKSA